MGSIGQELILKLVDLFKPLDDLPFFFKIMFLLTDLLFLLARSPEQESENAD
jgi:hypothetical protein